MNSIKSGKYLIAGTIVSLVGIYYGAVLANKIIKNTTVDIYIHTGKKNKCKGEYFNE